MRKVTCFSVAPTQLTTLQKEAIIKLHQSQFHLSENEIISLLNQREKVRLYYDYSNRSLVGTVGIQDIYPTKKTVMVYLGNIVIDERYQRYGILSDTILREIFRLFCVYPFHKKFQVSLATTSKAYSYYQRLPHAWPRIDEQTPQEVQMVLEKIAHDFFEDKFHLNEQGNIIIDKLHQDKSDVFKTNDVNNSAFFQLNPNHIEGDQLLCCAAFTWKNFFSIVNKFFTKRFSHILNKVKPIFTRSRQ